MIVTLAVMEYIGFPIDQFLKGKEKG